MDRRRRRRRRRNISNQSVGVLGVRGGGRLRVQAAAAREDEAAGVVQALTFQELREANVAHVSSSVRQMSGHVSPAF